ncbi:tyrosine-type recombinase/integrase [Cellulomonas pakistanensis]|uniref:tyrosine-type recombinase/integrase n=1 Tax=Cellulomonas pakistanensis TaxID=992287 RepID=UPI0019457ED8|nr:tyrosine-type recombinase/integrase [Cellulomonas pakistanensis]
MAYVEQRKRAGAGGKVELRYVGRYRIDGRLKSTRTFKVKRDALAEAEAQERAGKSSEWVDPSLARVTVDEWFRLWQGARSGRAPRTTEAETERYASLIAPAFGSTILRRLDYSDIATWAATMRSKRTGDVASQARRRDAVRLLVQILDGAVDSRRLRHNPARTPSGKVPYLPRASRSKEHRYLSNEQLRRLVDAAGAGEGSALILLTGLTGLRWGELSALLVEDVDLQRGRVSVRRAYTRLDSGALVLGDTKTHARREVPIGGTLRARLQPLLAGKRKSELLFTSRTGEPLRRESFTRSTFQPAVRAAGGAVTALQRALGLPEASVTGVYDERTRLSVIELQARGGISPTGVCDPETWAHLATEDRQCRAGMTQGEKVSRTRQLATLTRMTLAPGAEDFASLTFHDLRHTAASLAVANGATVKAVQLMLGHESAKLTLDTYAGLFESDLDSLGATMSDAFDASAAHYVLTDPGPSVSETIRSDEPNPA